MSFRCCAHGRILPHHHPSQQPSSQNQLRQRRPADTEHGGFRRPRPPAEYGGQQELGQDHPGRREQARATLRWRLVQRNAYVFQSTTDGMGCWMQTKDNFRMPASYTKTLWVKFDTPHLGWARIFSTENYPGDPDPMRPTSAQCGSNTPALPPFRCTTWASMVFQARSL